MTDKQPAASPAITKGTFDMNPFHAVVWTDHQSAQVLQFDAEHVLAQRIRTHTYHTAQHGGAVRSEHEFFGDICDVLDGIAEVLVTGSHTAIADFRRYTEKHRRHTATRVGRLRSGRPSDRQPAGCPRSQVLPQARPHGRDHADLSPAPYSRIQPATPGNYSGIVLVLLHYKKAHNTKIPPRPY